MKSSTFEGGRFVQGVVLFGFSVYLIKLFETGDINRLVSPNIALLLKITLGVLLVMMFYALGTIFRKTEHGGHRDHGHHHHDAHQHHFNNHNHAHHHHGPACNHDHHHDHTHAHGHAHHHHGPACNHDHNPRPRKRLLLLIAPVMIGLCLPTQSLGSSMLNNSLRAKMALNYLASVKRVPAQLTTTTVAQIGTTPATNKSTSGSASSGASSTHSTTPSTATTTASNVVDLSKVPKQPSLDGTIPPKPTTGGELSLYDLFNNLMIAPENYYNQRFSYTGFVYHPPGWPTNRFVLTRYLITCCTADATPIGLTIETNDAAKYADDTWLQISGPLSARTIPDASDLLPLNWYYGTDLMPTVIAQTIKTIPQPTEPYLYPAGKSANSPSPNQIPNSTTTGGK